MKGRDKGMEYVRHFVDDVQANGTLAQAVTRAGLRVRPETSGRIAEFSEHEAD